MYFDRITITLGGILEHCPITNEPLMHPGHVVSKTACQMLKNATNNLADVMVSVQCLLAGEGRPRPAVHSHTPAGSKPPISLTILDQIDDIRDTIDAWAAALMGQVNPSFRYRPGDWQTIQAIFHQHAEKCMTWTTEYDDIPEGVTCIETVLAAMKKLDRILNPPRRELTGNQIDQAKERLKTSSFTIGPACRIITELTGIQLKPDRIRQWKKRGQIASIGEPPKYQISELLERLGA